MLLALDESLEGTYKVVGCLCVPLDLFPDTEKKFISNRIDEKVWAELKWQKISSSYLDKYKKFITSYFESSGCTFHSWAYKIPAQDLLSKYYDSDANKVIYKQAYMLIRSVMWKCINNGYTGPFYVLPDESGSLGKSEYTITQKLLNLDPRIRPHPSIEYCSPGNSTVCGALQISDICTGAVSSVVNKLAISPASQEIINTLTSINEGIPIDFQFPSLPSLHQYKIHHNLCPK